MATVCFLIHPVRFFALLVGVCTLFGVLLQGQRLSGKCYTENKLGSSESNPIGPTIKTLVGKAVYVDCQLFENSTANVSRIMWKFNTSEVPSSAVERMDSHTLRLNLVNLTVNDSGYYRCVERNQFHQNTGICIAKVVVGHFPHKVDNVSCLATNWQYLVCSWNSPFNHIKTTDKLVLNDGIHDRKECEVKKLLSRQLFCNFTEDGNIPYPKNKRYLTLKFTRYNEFGTTTSKFEVDHFAIMKPDSPVNVTVFSNTSRSLSVRWQLSFNLLRFRPGFVCRVMYSSKWTEFKNASILPRNKFYTTLTQLTPYTLYSIAVDCQSAVANSTDAAMWSRPTVIEAWTLSDVPGSPPQIAPGSFQMHQYINNRTIIVYWKKLSAIDCNSENVFYVAAARSLDTDIELEPVLSKNESAVFRSLSLNEAYEIDVWAENEKGKSQEKSTIVVESLQNMPKQPSTLMVVAYNMNNFDVSWTPPTEVGDVVGYTVFWTQSSDRFEKNDNGQLYWQTVDKDTRNLRVTVDGSQPFSHFAVATNGRKSAGSLVWNTCIMSYNGTIGKLKKVGAAQAGPFGIHVNWSLDCSEKLGIITGYKVYYCLAEDVLQLSCTGNLSEVFVSGMNVNSYTITEGLRPYSRYKIVVSAVSRAGEGEHSEGRYVTTAEAEPSGDLNVQVLDVSNSSFVVKWNTPLFPNGNITEYRVSYSAGARIGNIIRYPVSKRIAEEPFSTHLQKIDENVLPYSEYSVVVDACTRAGCSHSLKSVNFTTDIGVPGQMFPPKVRFYNSTCVLVQPDVGHDVNGPGSYWEVRAVFGATNDEFNETDNMVKIFNVTGEMLYLPVECESSEGDEVPVVLWSRMINVKKDEELIGPWSDYSKSSGYCIIGTSLVLIAAVGLIGLVIFLVLATITFFATKRVKVIWYKVQNINVKLPDGLVDATKDMSGFTNGQKMLPKMNSYANLGTIYGSATKPLIDDQRIRNDSGGTNRSTRSTDGLLLHDYGGSGTKNAWVNDSLGSINQESVSSMPSTMQTQLSSDSSMDLNSSVPESPDSVFAPGEHPLKNVIVGNSSPLIPAVAVTGANGFNPTLTPIGEFHDGTSSQDGTPRHYSKFANYLDSDEVLASKPSLSRGYVAAPYSKFGDVDDYVAAADAPRASTPTEEAVPLDAGTQAYSKFGSTLPFSKVSGVNNPRTSVASQNSMGYSVFGMAEEPMADSNTSFLAGPSKGYVTTAALNEKAGSANRWATARSRDVSPVAGTSKPDQRNIDDGEMMMAAAAAADSESDSRPCSNYVDIADSDSHKRSPSNTSSLTMGYSKMGLSRPTSTCSDSGHYVLANPSPSFITSTPTKSSSRDATSSPSSSPYRNVDCDGVVATSAATDVQPGTDGADFKAHGVSAGGGGGGYASVNRLLANNGGNS